MDAIFCALTKEEFNLVSTATSANQIWYTLQVTHEGINKVKESKISILIHRFELFKMKENETISEMVTRFTDITNSLEIHPSQKISQDPSYTHIRLGEEDNCNQRSE